MYTVKNKGSFPVIIRDLNLHISGGKTVDLDTLFKQDTVRRSVDLQKLIERDKLELVEKETVKVAPKKVARPSLPQNPQSDQQILIALQKGFLEIKEMLQSGTVLTPAQEKVIEEYDEETRKRITELQVQNLSGEIGKTEKNFDQIGESTRKHEQLNDLLNVLDDIEKEGE